MTYSAAVSTPSIKVSTDTPVHPVSNLDHFVTQWMSLVTCSVGSLRNSSHVQLLGLSISPSMTKLHSATGMRGVGAADNTGMSLTTYCPGGSRELLAVSRSVPRNPRDMKDIDGLLLTPHRNRLQNGSLPHGRHRQTNSSSVVMSMQPPMLLATGHRLAWKVCERSAASRLSSGQPAR